MLLIYADNLRESTRVSIPLAVALLRHEHSGIRLTAMSVLQNLVEYDEFHRDIRPSIPYLIVRLGDKDRLVRKASVTVLIKLATRGRRGKL